MAQAQPSARRHNLVCAVCREVYRSPRLLPQCHHSFCLPCLEGMARTHGRFFPCPTCRTSVKVPDGGVQRFAVNFYIPEEDLERERNQVFKPICGIHGTDELIFFCKQCEQAICLRCKLTKHDHHPTEDLSDTAQHCRKLLKSSRKRLKKSAQKLAKASELSRDDLKAAKEKADFLKTQIQEQYDSIVAMVTQQRDQTLRDLDALTHTMDSDLNTHVSTVQRHLDSLIQLQQQVSHAIDSDNDAEVVVVQREVSEGAGSVEELERMEKSLSCSTQRPGLQWDAPVLRQHDVATWFGSPVRLYLPRVAHHEKVTPVYRCEEVNGCREVNAFYHCLGDSVTLRHGGRALASQREVNIQVRPDTGKAESVLVMRNNLSAGHIIYTKRHDGVVDTQNNPLHAVVTKWDNSTVTFDLEDDSTPVAIDADLAYKLLVVLSEYSSPPAPGDNSTITSPSLAAVHGPPKTRTVQLYLPGQSKPVSRYTPPQHPFFPTDVCFWHGHCKSDHLLISDMATDSVHVVSTDNNQLQFLHYLASGSPYILRPTALICNWRMPTVFIGCENGWVLRCTDIHDAEPDEREEEEMDEDEEQEGGEGAGEAGSNGGSHLLHVENDSESTVSVDTW